VLLPADARFCHKCGKPQYAEDIERMAAVEAEITPPPAPMAKAGVTPGSGVGNLRAVGVTMAAAAMALIGLLLIGFILPPAMPLILSASGFGAARFYSSKQAISALSGALLGSMTGVWLFLVFASSCLVVNVGLGSPEGQQMMKGMSPNVAEMYRKFEDPHQLFTILLVTFFALVLSATFGGLLAARLGRQNR
jgi:hypothetical protein